MGIELFIRNYYIDHLKFVATLQALNNSNKLQETMDQYTNLLFPWLKNQTRLTAEEVADVFENHLKNKVIYISPTGTPNDQYLKGFVDDNRKLLKEHKKIKKNG